MHTAMFIGILIALIITILEAPKRGRQEREKRRTNLLDGGEG